MNNMEYVEQVLLKSKHAYFYFSTLLSLFLGTKKEMTITAFVRHLKNEDMAMVVDKKLVLTERGRASGYFVVRHVASEDKDYIYLTAPGFYHYCAAIERGDLM